MIKVSVEVREGTALFREAVQAESIDRAMSIMKGCHPDRDVRVVFPIDPEEFFLGGAKLEGNRIKGSGGMRLLPGRVTAGLDRQA
jgi:hypothetical protein